MSKKKKIPAKCAPRCPYCGAISYLRSAEGIYIDNSKNAMLYVCKNYPACDAYVRVHPGTTIPMGTLANRKVRALRAEAHKYFNKIYLRGIMSREDAYEWLSAMLGIPIGNTHIGQMGEYYCQKVIDESKRLLAAHAKRSFRNECERRLARCS